MPRKGNEKLTKGGQPRCQKSVRVAGLRWPTFTQCTNAAKCEREGVGYCNLHDPVAVAAKQSAKQSQFQRQHDARIKAHQRQIDCLRACEGIENPVEALAAVRLECSNLICEVVT